MLCLSLGSIGGKYVLGNVLHSLALVLGLCDQLLVLFGLPILLSHYLELVAFLLL